MSLPKMTDGDARISVPMTGPAESTHVIDGRMYLLRTWTAAQWDRLPPEERPRVSRPHGTGRAAIEAS